MSAARSSPALIIGIFSVAVRLIVRIGATRLLYLKLSQNRFRKARGAFGVRHYDIGRERAHPELLDCGDIAAVRIVEHENACDVAIESRDAERRYFHPESAEHFVGGTFDSFGSDYGTDRRDSRFLSADRVANFAQFEDRSQRDQTVRRRKDDPGRFFGRP